MIYIACPVGVISDRSDMAHQLCSEFIRCQVPARMYYYDLNGSFTSWGSYLNSPYSKYSTPSAASFEEMDQPGNHVILQETSVSLRNVFSSASVHVWWITVDEYLLSVAASPEKLGEDVNFFGSNSVIHFAGSDYAYKFLTDDMNIPRERIMYLTEYIDDCFLNLDISNCDIRENTVYYYTDEQGVDLSGIVEAHPEIEWVSASGMSTEQRLAGFQHAKVFLDFSSHPGKQRITREAVSCGLCVLTNLSGAAAYITDYPVPENCRFPSGMDSKEEICVRIKDCIDNYEQISKTFSNYREWIKGERKRFINEVKNIACIWGEYSFSTAYCVVTKDDPESVEIVLGHMIDSFRDRGIDVYYFDASEDDKTKCIVDRYRQLGYDNIYHIAFPPETHPIKRMDKVIKGDLLPKKYDYIWPSKSGLYFETDYLDLLLEAQRMGADLIFSDYFTHGDGVVKGARISPVELYSKRGPIITAWGLVVLNYDTMCGGDIWYDGLTEKDHQSNFGYYEYVFNRIVMVPDVMIISVFDSKYHTTGARVSGVRSDEGIVQFLKIWKDKWIAANLSLPDVYNEYKASVIKDQTNVPYMFGDVDILKRIHAVGGLTSENVEEILENWEMISDLPTQTVRDIACGRYTDGEEV